MQNCYCSLFYCVTNIIWKFQLGIILFFIVYCNASVKTRGYNESDYCCKQINCIVLCMMLKLDAFGSLYSAWLWIEIFYCKIVNK